MEKEQKTQGNILQKLVDISTVRVIFGSVWAIDAFFKWQPAFQKGYLDVLVGTAKDQPLFIKPWFDFWVGLVSYQTAFFVYATAIIETYLAVALLFGFAKRFTYTLAFVFGLLIWSTAEGFGGPYTLESTDIGAGIMYSILALALLIVEVKYRRNESKTKEESIVNKPVRKFINRK